MDGFWACISIWSELAIWVFLGKQQENWISWCCALIVHYFVGYNVVTLMQGATYSRCMIPINSCPYVSLLARNTLLMSAFSCVWCGCLFPFQIYKVSVHAPARTESETHARLCCCRISGAAILAPGPVRNCNNLQMIVNRREVLDDNTSVPHNSRVISCDSLINMWGNLFLKVSDMFQNFVSGTSLQEKQPVHTVGSWENLEAQSGVELSNDSFPSFSGTFVLMNNGDDEHSAHHDYDEHNANRWVNTIIVHWMNGKASDLMHARVRHSASSIVWPFSSAVSPSEGDVDQHRTMTSVWTASGRHHVHESITLICTEVWLERCWVIGICLQAVGMKLLQHLACDFELFIRCYSCA